MITTYLGVAVSPAQASILQFNADMVAAKYLVPHGIAVKAVAIHRDCERVREWRASKGIPA